MGRGLYASESEPSTVGHIVSRFSFVEPFSTEIR